MSHTYLIGEIGQNHNGSVEIAKKIIDVVVAPVIDKLFDAKLKPIDAVKLTRRDLNEELSVEEMNKPYDSPHSFGKTYGEHREFLELNDEEHFEVYRHAKKLGLDFIETFCARGCLSMLKLFIPDRLKVASRDLSNLPLLHALAETGIPIILSTGMGEKKQLDEALDVITRYHEKISILHCLSQYPAEYKNINLRTITWLKKHYPGYPIGYSDHSIGILMPSVAVAMGAGIIEKHITLDRKMKGSDHAGSLGPEGIFRMVRDVRNTEHALGKEEMFISSSVAETRRKLERSIATSRALPKGHKITQDDIHLLSPGDGYKWSDRASVIGWKTAAALPADTIIYPDKLEKQ